MQKHGNIPNEDKRFEFIELDRELPETILVPIQHANEERLMETHTREFRPLSFAPPDNYPPMPTQCKSDMVLEKDRDDQK